MNDEITIDGVRYKRMDRIADRVSTHVMFDCHMFDELKAATVQGLVDEWRAINADEASLEKYGAASLCPAIVLDGTTELRRVGRMAFKESDLPDFVKALEADPDVTRLLALRRGEGR